jgi:glycosyltransferase involved in cell wall biosynthesis
MSVSVVIPALDVSDTLGGVVKAIWESAFVDEIIVVDNDSEDNTFEVARRHGANALQCNQRGLGYAVKTGILASKNSLVMKIDGDIQNVNPNWVAILLSGLVSGSSYVSGTYTSEYDEFPVGTLVAKPGLSVRYPALQYVRMPLAGTYLFRKEGIVLDDLPNDWAFDLALLVHAHHATGPIAQVDLGLLNDKPKRISDYSVMALDILRFLFGNPRPQGD